MRANISKKTKKFLVGTTVSAILVAIILIFSNTQNGAMSNSHNPANALENLFYDLFFKIKTYSDNDNSNALDKVTVNNNYYPGILIVDIDEASLDKLGPYNEWDRDIHANVVNNLSAGGASAIGFDILFKTADFGKKKTAQVIGILQNIKQDSLDENTYAQIHANYNFDSLLVDAVKNSGNTIVSDMFSEIAQYKHESQWRPLSGEFRAQTVGLQYTFNDKQIDYVENIEPKDLLDNVFPELARAGAGLGAVNAYPDNDGVVRRISMLYRFPNMDLQATADTNSNYSDVSFIKKSRVYTTMPLMILLHIFHQKPENVIIKMGRYIDIGKPFGVYRDSSGLHTTYPNFSYPMFKALKEKLSQNKIEKLASTDFIDVSSTVIASKNLRGQLSLEILEGQVLDEDLSETLLSITPNTLDFVQRVKKLKVAPNVTLKKDEESLDRNRFILEYSENSDDDFEEFYINRYTVKTLQFFADSIQRIKPSKKVHLSLETDIRYNKQIKKWQSNQVILSDAVIKDIQATDAQKIRNLKIGEEIRFGNAKKIPIDKFGRFQVNYNGNYNTQESKRTFQHISYYDVSKGRVDPAFYQGKIFILGSAAPALYDFVTVPSEENYPAVLIHANILKNILEEDFMRTLSLNTQQLITILLALICIFLGLYLKSYFSATLSVALMGLYVFIAYRYFEGGLFIGVSKQLLAMLLTNIAALVVQFYYENKEKSFINNAFKQYISPELIDAMVSNEIMPTLGGEKSNITAYFTDIASFSTFSEKIGDPSKLVDLLNEYLTVMTDTLLYNKGTLDKYEGDAIIAFFGAPMQLPNHAQSACECAVDMQNKLLDLRKKWANEDAKWPSVIHNMHMRIGINSGDIVTGNMGSKMRKNYTMMGDAVNLASRLESAAKQYGAYIQISENTQKKLTPNSFIYRTLDTIRVVGKSEPVKTFELLEKSNSPKANELNKLVEIWERARKSYLEMNFDEAINLFTECLELEPHHPDRDLGSKTTPSHIYIERCKMYKITPPKTINGIWDGVFTATQK